MGLVKRFTLDERLEIRRLLDLKLAVAHIARRLNRSSTSLRTQVATNGGRDHYDPIQANGRLIPASLYNKDKRGAKRNKNQIKPEIEEEQQQQSAVTKTTTNIEERIEIIEMQLEILYDTIKELRNVKKD